MSMGHACKFFGFSITYTILNIPLFCTYQLCLIPAPFPPLSPFPRPADTYTCNPHIFDSVHVLVVCLVCFFFLDSAVDSCEFVAILMFIVLTFFFFLNKSL